MSDGIEECPASSGWSRQIPLDSLESWQNPFPSGSRVEELRRVPLIAYSVGMPQIDLLLSGNAAYSAARANVADPRPGRRLAIVTCMDARIDVFAALGLHLGEALVLRNAGGRVTDDVLRSLALGVHVLGVDTVVVMQHTKCGLSGVTNEDLQELTGSDLGFFPIDDHAERLREDINVLTGQAYLNPIGVISGFIYDVESGEIDDVIRWERANTN